MHATESSDINLTAMEKAFEMGLNYVFAMQSSCESC